MPSVTHGSRAAVAPGEFWDLIVNLDNWADLIPGYVRHHETSPDESIWTVRGDVGILTRDVELRVMVIRRDPQHLVEFRIEGITEQMIGHGCFRVGSGRPADDREPPANAGRHRIGIFARWIDRLVRRCLRSQAPGGQTVPTPKTADGSTEFSFELHLGATGVTGPVVNRLIAPLLSPAAESLAAGIAERAQASETLPEGIMPLRASGKGDQ